MAKAYQSGDIVKNKYRIVRVLGKGGFAVTYEAIDMHTELSVAIKVISLKQLENWKQIELFQREAAVLANLEHPAIPKYIDYFDLDTETDKTFYIVQQLAPGKSLFDLVKSGWRTNEREVKNIAQQILNILSYLHSLEPPVIHRDIKPNNLIRSDDGTIYLVDFGAVQNTYYNTLMQGSTVVGTYGYMAPEQFRGKALPATDLYSLGATILYLLTHRSPSELPQDTLKLNFRNSVNISEAFADWLEKILEPDVEDRFSFTDVALNELLASNKVKKKRLFTSISVSVLCLGLIWGFTSYKWFFLSYLGFYPTNLCDYEVSLEFLNQKGDINAVSSNEQAKLLACIIRNENTSHLKKVIANINDIVKLIDNQVLFYESRKRNYLLHEAVLSNNYEIVKILVDLGISIDVVDRREQTPLFYAVEKNYINIIELLISRGANINLQDNNGQSLLFLASDNVAKILIKNGADVNVKSKSGETLLFMNILTNNMEMVKLLIKNGADVNIKKSLGETSLFSAIDGNRLEMVKLILENGADINIQSNSGETPLHRSTLSSQIAIFELLIKHVIDVNKQTVQGNTALFYAVYWDKKEKVEILIKNGANVNAKNKRGETPLFYSKENQNTEIVKLLIKYGADLNIKDNNGNTAFLANPKPLDQLGLKMYKTETKINQDILKILSTAH